VTKLSISVSQIIDTFRQVRDRVGDGTILTTHAESSITNDPNDWAKEVGNPRYILDLLLSVINVSLQTVELVDQLPTLKFE